MTDWLATFPMEREFVLSQEQARLYAAAANDPNPLHEDPRLAQRLGLEVIPVPGMLVMGLIAEWTSDWPVVLSHLSVRFLRPMGGQDYLLAAARVAARSDAVATLRLSVKNGPHLAVLGEAIVRPPISA